MKILVVYDNDGYILHHVVENNPRVPNGVQHILQDLPNGKQLKTTNGIGVNIKVNPHELILTDIPSDPNVAFAEVINKKFNELLSAITDIGVVMGDMMESEAQRQTTITELALLMNTLKGGK